MATILYDQPATQAATVGIASRHAAKPKSFYELYVSADVGPDSVPPDGFPIKVDSECMTAMSRKVNGAGELVYQVERGLNLTAVAAHSAGATVTAGWGGAGGVTVTGSQGGSVAGATTFQAAGTVVDLGSGVAGQGLVETRIGPFPIGFADVLGSGGNFPILLAPLTDGSLVVAVSIYVSDAFDTAIQMQIDIAPSDDLTNGSDLLLGGNNAGAKIDSVRSGDATHYLLPARSSAGTALTVEPVLAVGNSSLIAYFSDIPTTGQLDIYAIIVTPAS